MMRKGSASMQVIKGSTGSLSGGCKQLGSKLFDENNIWPLNKNEYRAQKPGIEGKREERKLIN